MADGYLTQYITVLLGFVALLYVWPRVVFAKYLKGKSKWYQLFFCACSMFLICNLVVVLLGSSGCLNSTAMYIIFYGIFALAAIWWIVSYVKKYITADKENKPPIPIIDDVILWCQGYKQKFVNSKKRSLSQESPWIDLVLNILLIIIIGALMFHFSEYARTNLKYGFSDMPRHDAWIRQLMEGQFYNDGVYPFGMHFVMYTMTTVLHIDLTWINLHAGSITCLLFFIAFYYLLKEVFNSKMAIVAAFALFLIIATTVTVYEANERMVYDGFHKFRWTLPQEFCYFSAFLAPALTAKILKSKDSMKNGNNIAYLILLAMCLGTTICTHYYTAAFMAIMCICMALAHVLKFNLEKFVALAISVITGLLTALIPLGIAYLKVGKWSYAVTWAQNVPSGESRVFEQLASVVPSNTNTEGGNTFVSMLQSFWNDAYAILFRDYTGLFTVLILIGLATLILCIFKRKNMVSNYLYGFLSLIAFMIMYAAPVLNITRLLESYRVVHCLFCSIIIVSCIVLDYFTDTTALITPQASNNKNKKKKKIKYAR